MPVVAAALADVLALTAHRTRSTLLLAPRAPTRCGPLSARSSRMLLKTFSQPQLTLQPRLTRPLQEYLDAGAEGADAVWSPERAVEPGGDAALAGKVGFNQAFEQVSSMLYLTTALDIATPLCCKPRCNCAVLFVTCNCEQPWTAYCCLAHTSLAAARIPHRCSRRLSSGCQRRASWSCARAAPSSR